MEPGSGEPDEVLVRNYLAALNNGQLIDALNAFATDARFRDESGRERNGIREIAAAFAGRQGPMKVEIESLQRERDAVTVLVRMAPPGLDAPRAYRVVFHVRRDRIRSLVIDPLPRLRSPPPRNMEPA